MPGSNEKNQSMEAVKGQTHIMTNRSVRNSEIDQPSASFDNVDPCVRVFCQIEVLTPAKLEQGK